MQKYTVYCKKVTFWVVVHFGFPIVPTSRDGNDAPEDRHARMLPACIHPGNNPKNSKCTTTTFSDAVST